MLAQSSRAANVLKVSLSPSAASINMAKYPALLLAQSIKGEFQGRVILRGAPRNVRAHQRRISRSSLPYGLSDLEIQILPWK